MHIKYLYGKSEAVQQAESMVAKIKTTEITKICIHMHKVAATLLSSARWQKRFTPCDKKNCCCMVFKVEKGSGCELLPNFSAVENGQKKWDFQIALLLMDTHVSSLVAAPRHFQYLCLLCRLCVALWIHTPLYSNHRQLVPQLPAV